MLEKVDLSLKLDTKEYEKELLDIQLKLVLQQQRMRKAGLPLVIMYEGWDASGKGGSILRITQKIDPRGYRVWPVGVPNEIEQQHDYLWRFWTRMPARGEVCIFDRSWYGRVLVERVEKLTDEENWQRAYKEIRHFERTLIDNGACPGEVLAADQQGRTVSSGSKSARPTRSSSGRSPPTTGETARNGTNTPRQPRICSRKPIPITRPGASFPPNASATPAWKPAALSSRPSSRL